MINIEMKSVNALDQWILFFPRLWVLLRLNRVIFASHHFPSPNSPWDLFSFFSTLFTFHPFLMFSPPLSPFFPPWCMAQSFAMVWVLVTKFIIAKVVFIVFHVKVLHHHVSFFIFLLFSFFIYFSTFL